MAGQMSLWSGFEGWSGEDFVEKPRSTRYCAAEDEIQKDLGTTTVAMTLFEMTPGVGYLRRE